MAILIRLGFSKYWNSMWGLTIFKAYSAQTLQTSALIHLLSILFFKYKAMQYSYFRCHNLKFYQIFKYLYLFITIRLANFPLMLAKSRFSKRRFKKLVKRKYRRMCKIRNRRLRPMIKDRFLNVIRFIKRQENITWVPRRRYNILYEKFHSRKPLRRVYQNKFKAKQVYKINYKIKNIKNNKNNKDKSKKKKNNKIKIKDKNKIKVKNKRKIKKVLWYFFSLLNRTTRTTRTTRIMRPRLKKRKSNYNTKNTNYNTQQLTRQRIVKNFTNKSILKKPQRKLSKLPQCLRKPSKVNLSRRIFLKKKLFKPWLRLITKPRVYRLLRSFFKRKCYSRKLLILAVTCAKTQIVKKRLKRPVKYMWKHLNIFFCLKYILAFFKTLCTWFLFKILKITQQTRIFFLIMPIKEFFLSPEVIVQFIKSSLKARHKVFHILKFLTKHLNPRNITLIKRTRILGYKIILSGRFIRRGRSKYKIINVAKIKPKNLYYKSDYACGLVILTNSICGIKVWLTVKTEPSRVMLL